MFDWYLCSCLSDRLSESTAQTLLNLHFDHVTALHNAVIIRSQNKSLTSHLALEKLQEALSNALMTLKRISTAEKFNLLLCDIKWVTLLLGVARSPCNFAVLSVCGLKPRLLALLLLDAILRCGDIEQKGMVVEQLFELLAGTTSKQLDSGNSCLEVPAMDVDLLDEDDGMVPLHMKFEQSRSVRCKVMGNVITHQSSNDGYAVGSMALYSGLFRWKV